jgi:Domain of unknown function (DUF4190)
MTYPPSGTPDPYQPQQPYGPGSDPTAQDPYAAPGSGVPASGSGAPASDVPGSGIPGNGPPPGAYGSPQYPSSGQPYGQSPYDQNPYAQPQYGAPQYGQSPYGQPQYGAYGPQARTNGLAIASLVCSLAGLLTCISAPVGVVLGHIARRQIRETGEQGEGLATAGLWVGYILSVLGLLFIAFYVVIIVFAIAHGDSTST